MLYRSVYVVCGRLYSDLNLKAKQLRKTGYLYIVFVN